MRERWKRVGIFIRARREELGLSQGDVIRALGYKSRNAVSNVELGIDGLPAKRAYAWAEVLDVPRQVFFEFVIGERDNMDPPKAAKELSVAEEELLANYRKLTAKGQRRLREHAVELATLERVEQQRR